ncbi:NADPH:quinone oxidoreductase family protein [Cryobacterium sp. TMS1-20-1]|uniref:NADPH:quinone oxidoreductase family protein n=1 Tax=Cryobacterium sp. TMS1-20-1 TaxID=1259223 RepID=UPI001F543427|nr:NADPH:quinone oxidoreductase family protein [Cryobacterium sp. TMS1-20-1]
MNMLAWTFREFGDPSAVLELASVPVPHPRPGQVLVRVDAAAVNFADGLLVRGDYQIRPPLPAIAGVELAGRVVVADPAGGGPERRTLVAGMASGMTGAFAGFAVLDRADAQTVPASFDAVSAASFTVSYQTAWFTLHRRCGLQAGETVLVHAAAGGVGSASVQLAKAHGATVIGLVGSAAKRAAALDLGCDQVLIRGEDDPVAVVKELTAGRGVDVVVDPVGGSSHTISERVVGFEGRIAIVGFASGTFPVVRAERALVKNYSIIGVHFGLYRTKRPDLVERGYRELCDTVERFGIEPLVSAVRPFRDAPAALADVASGTSLGRVVLEISEDAAGSVR